MRKLEVKDWKEYSEEDKATLISFWWNSFGKGLLSRNIDINLSTSWWFNFGRSVITLDEWKKLEKLEREDAEEISLLKAVYSDLASTNNNYNMRSRSKYSESNQVLVNRLVSYYNTRDFINSKAPAKQLFKS